MTPNRPSGTLPRSRFASLNGTKMEGCGGQIARWHLTFAPKVIPNNKNQDVFVFAVVQITPINQNPMKIS